MSASAPEQRECACDPQRLKQLLRACSFEFHRLFAEPPHQAGAGDGPVDTRADAGAIIGAGVTGGRVTGGTGPNPNDGCGHTLGDGYGDVGFEVNWTSNANVMNHQLYVYAGAASISATPSTTLALTINTIR